MKKFIKRILDKLVNPGMSPGRFASSCCLGMWIGLSPFLGIQTWIAIPLSWLLGLYTPVVITVLYLINNPLTMIPIVVIDYATGYWLIEKWLGINLIAYNPSFVSWVNRKIGRYIRYFLGVSEIGFWYYMLGGMLFATVLTLPFYVPLKKLFKKLIVQRERATISECLENPALTKPDTKR